MPNLDSLVATATRLEDPTRAVRLDWEDERATYRAWVAEDGALGKKAYRIPKEDDEDPASMDLTTKTWEPLAHMLRARTNDVHFVTRARAARDKADAEKANAKLQEKLNRYKDALNAAGFDPGVYEDKDLLDLEKIFQAPQE